jgi:hypothetical protein
MDMLQHKDLDIVRKNLPGTGPQANYYKQILLHIDFDDQHDIYNLILGLTAVTKTMMDILVRNQVKLNQDRNKGKGIRNESIM